MAAALVVSSCGSSPSIQTQQNKSYHLRQLPATASQPTQPLRTLHISTPDNGSANVSSTDAVSSDAVSTTSNSNATLGSGSVNNSKTRSSSAKKKASGK